MNLDGHEGGEQRLLVLTPTGADSRLAVQLLRRCGFNAEACVSSEQFYRELGSDLGALIIADEALTPELVDRLISILEDQPPWSDIPVIVLSRHQTLGSTAHTFPKLYQRANVTVLERPLKTDILLSVVRNVLSARQRQYEVRSLLNTLQQKVRERDHFLAMLAHELRNPLSVISNSLQLLNHSVEAKRSRPLELATRQTNVIGRLLDDLLDVARFANGKISLEKENIALSTVMANAVEVCRRNMLEKRQHFTPSVGRDVVVNGDPTRLTQLFSNLLMNASKYTPADGKIDIQCEIQGSKVAVSIKDNGIGIKPELLAHLFEPFVQGDQGIERSQGGLGLGLALAKSIAEHHGGSITVTSAGTGRGSEFTVRLPVASAEPAKTRSEPSLNGAQYNGSLRIMLAEDDADAAESLEGLLRVCGYDVHIVKDGRAALAAAFVLQPEVVLLDIGLPEMNGYELARELRERLPDRKLLLVALSGYGQPEDLRRSREAGIDHHLVKPLHLEKLQEILSEYEAEREISRA
jgi:signal transduction histidine kinase/ActR/RegA family two-component response regulator